MRIDFSWGSDRARVEHPVCRLAELVLSPWVSAHSVGPGLPWLDVLFVVPGRHAPKPPQACWRWRNSFAQHLLVEIPAPSIEGMDELEAARSLIAQVDQAIRLALPLLDPALPFAARRLKARVADCLREPRTASHVQKLREPQQHARRFAAIELGKEAMRREWKRPLTKPLKWVRVYPTLGKGGRASSLLRQECNIVGALLGSALYDAVLTPRYAEIYINVGNDAATLRAERTAVEEWHENAYALLPPRALAESNPRKLRRALFKAARSALLELASVDHLDATTIKARLAVLDVDELGTEFVYKRIEKGGRFAEIFYTLADRRDARAILQPNFRMRAGLSGSKGTACCLLGPVDLQMSAGAIAKFELSRGEARVSYERKLVALAFPD
jgi:hypothetical protein